MTHTTPPPSRREFLAAMGLTALGTALPPNSVAAEQTSAVLTDSSHELKATGADLGSLWPEVEKLAEANRYTDSFPSVRFRTFAQFQSIARDKLLEVLLYRPSQTTASRAAGKGRRESKAAWRSKEDQTLAVLAGDPYV